MSHPHYYASTSRNLDRVLQYGVYPFAYMVGLVLHRDNAKATQWARFSGAASSALITTAFVGLESQALDSIVRDAVTAEMGIDANKFQPSDCKYSKNIIAHEGYKDFVGLQPKRYIKDAMYLLPTFIETIYGMGNKGKPMPISKEIRASFDARGKSYNPGKHSTWDIIANGHVGWDMSIYMATSAYWGFETFLVGKKSYYPVAQDIVGKIKPTDGDIDLNNLMDIYQRSRNDRKLPMIHSHEEHEAVRSLLTRLVQAYNAHDGKMDVPEMVYLIGLSKINVHAPDGRTFSAEAVAQSHKEIDRVLAIGLNGIRDENRKLREQEAIAELGQEPLNGVNGESTEHRLRVSSALRRVEDRRKSFSDRFADGAISTTQGILSKIGMLPKRPESYISATDPTELIGNDSAFWR